jgi:hypothetical protein
VVLFVNLDTSAVAATLSGCDEWRTLAGERVKHRARGWTDSLDQRVAKRRSDEHMRSPVATTYTRKPDCTGTFSVQNGPNFNIFVAVDGSRLSVVATDPGVASSERSVRVGKTAP